MHAVKILCILCNSFLSLCVWCCGGCSTLIHLNYRSLRVILKLEMKTVLFWGFSSFTSALNSNSFCRLITSLKFKITNLSSKLCRKWSFWFGNYVAPFTYPEFIVLHNSRRFTWFLNHLQIDCIENWAWYTLSHIMCYLSRWWDIMT